MSFLSTFLFTAHQRRPLIPAGEAVVIGFAAILRRLVEARRRAGARKDRKTAEHG